MVYQGDLLYIIIVRFKKKKKLEHTRGIQMPIEGVQIIIEIHLRCSSIKCIRTCSND